MAIDRRGVTKVRHKVDASPVTEIDLVANLVPATPLAKLLSGCQVVSEEDPASLVYRQALNRFWLIAPPWWHPVRPGSCMPLPSMRCTGVVLGWVRFGG